LVVLTVIGSNRRCAMMELRARKPRGNRFAIVQIKDPSHTPRIERSGLSESESNEVVYLNRTEWFIWIERSGLITNGN